MRRFTLVLLVSAVLLAIVPALALAGGSDAAPLLLPLAGGVRRTGPLVLGGGALLLGLALALGLLSRRLKE